MSKDIFLINIKNLLHKLFVSTVLVVLKEFFILPQGRSFSAFRDREREKEKHGLVASRTHPDRGLQVP